jgi:hypothetical protein
MRIICGYCANINKPICKECTWIHTRYPSNYAGRKLNNKALKLASEPLQSRSKED